MNIKINNVIFIILIRIAKLKVFWNLQRKLEFKQCFWISRLFWKAKVNFSVKQDMHSKLGSQLARSRISECFSLGHFLWTFCSQLEHLILILLFFSLSRWNNVFEVLEDLKGFSLPYISSFHCHHHLFCQWECLLKSIWCMCSNMNMYILLFNKRCYNIW